MSNTKELKNYLLEKENAFLLDDTNNGKTIMLSGAWGAGKTHFWQNEISLTLADKLKENDKVNIYISLYGKESISEIKFEIFKEAYNAIVDEDIISKSASFLSSIAPSFGEKSLADGFDKLNQKSKDKKSKEILKDGSIICLDDFERKSKQIDLNDLFGLISHLALTHNCKVVIILNSDVFTGKEAEVFKNVKEKTVNKFFYFKPTIEELFESISKNKKYDILNDYKEDILKTIKETEELNARIYIQVLDNCLEWLEVKKILNKNIVRVLVLGTFNFVLNHIVFDYLKPVVKRNQNNLYEYRYKEINFTIKAINEYFKHIDNNIYSGSFLNWSSPATSLKEKEFIEFLIYKNINKEYLEKNKNKLKALWKYGYRLYYIGDVDEETYNKIAKFIKSGILI